MFVCLLALYTSHRCTDRSKNTAGGRLGSALDLINFWSLQVAGQGQGHRKSENRVKIVFLGMTSLLSVARSFLNIVDIENRLALLHCQERYEQNVSQPCFRTTSGCRATAPESKR